MQQPLRVSNTIWHVKNATNIYKKRKNDIKELLRSYILK